MSVMTGAAFLPASPTEQTCSCLCVQAEGVQEELRRHLAEVGRLQQAALAKGHRQEAALQQARQETLEAVQQGNHKYATMLAERMSIEDQLNHQLASKQQAAATRSVAMHVRGCLLLCLSCAMAVARRVCSALAADGGAQCAINAVQFGHSIHAHIPPTTGHACMLHDVNNANARVNLEGLILIELL